jgi:MoaA/NifB/PqqE/SkfB family radical SAM enzyme
MSTLSHEPNLVSKIWRYFVRTILKDPKRFVLISDVLDSKIPRLVGTEITNICNADCTFCGYNKGENGKGADDRKKTKLGFDVLSHTAKLFSNAGGGVYSLTPILGEVSAHPQWLEYVKELRKFPKITGVTCYTNAILLDRFGYKEILTSGITSMNISTALGNREQYKRLYAKDKYDQVLKNILGILETNISLGQPVNLTLKLRIDKPFDDFYESNTCKEILKYLPFHKIEILDDDWDDFKGLITEDKLPDGHSFKENVEVKTEPCYALFRKLQVMIDGTIQGCSCRVEPDLWSDNILNHETLESAWRNQKFDKLRSDWFDGKVPNCCKKCTHYIPYSKMIDNSRPNYVFRELFKSGVRKIKLKLKLSIN